MKTKNLGLSLILAMTYTAAAPAAHAQYGNNLVVQQGPGVYDRQSLDRTQLANSVLSQIDAENKAYVQAMLNSANDALTQLQRTVVDGQGELQTMSQNSMSGKYPALTDLMRVKANYQSRVLNVQRAVSALGTAAKKPDVTVDIEGKSMRFDGRVVADLGKMADVLSQQLDEIQKSVKNAPLRVVAEPGSVAYVQMTLDDALPAQLTAPAAKVIAAVRAEAQQLRSWDFAAVQPLNHQTRARIASVIEIYGKEQKYRFEMDKEGRERALKDLQEIFVARQVLRYQFGTPIGMIGVDYKKMIANLDQLNPNNAITFQQYDIYNFTEAQKAANLIANAKANMLRKNQAVFGKGVPFVDRVMSAVTTIKGEQAWAVINAYMINLLYEDAQQELMMDSLMAKQQIMASIQAKIQADPSYKAQVGPLFKQLIDLANDPTAAGTGNPTAMQDMVIKACVGLRDFKDRWAQSNLKMQLAENMSQALHSAAGDAQQAPDKSLENLFN